MLGAGDARDAEVHDLHGARLGDHQVGRLQIAVDDAHAVRVRERGEALHHQVGGALGRERTEALDHVLERLAADELHHHQPLPVVLEQLEDGGDAGMIEARDGDGFGAEAPGDFRIVQLGVEDLDRDIAVEGVVEGAKDRAHAAPPHPIKHAVLADVLPDHPCSLGILNSP